KALRHVFLAERAASQPVGLSAGITAAKIEQVTVIGAGTMGRGIALAFLDTGFAVRLVEPAAAVLDAAGKTIRTTIEQAVSKGRMTATAAEAALARLELVEGDATQVGNADLVVEAALEDKAIKTTIFATLDRHAPPHAILATN